MFKICVIGCGAMSSGGHGPSFAKYKNDYDDVSLAACCDLDAEKAKDYMEKFGFEKYYTDYSTMLEEIKPDAVSLVCPVKFTSDMAVDIIRKGYNLILEKPPGLNREEAERILNAANEGKVYVRTAFNRRYTPLILKLKESLKGKRIFNITYQMYRYQRNDADFATTAIHAIDAMKNIVGADYRKIDFIYQNVPEVGDFAANIYMSCEFENGTAGQLTIVPLGGSVIERITVNAMDETYFVELPFWNNLDVPGSFRAIKKNELTDDVSGDSLIDSGEMFEEMGFYEENRSFFEMIRNKEPISNDLESGIQSVDIANCIRERKSVYEKAAQ